MTWWGWTLVFGLLFVGSAVVLVRLGLQVWRKAMALFTEMGDASQRLGEVSDTFAELSQALQTVAPQQELAVFQDPVALRRSRDREVRSRYARGRRQGELSVLNAGRRRRG